MFKTRWHVVLWCVLAWLAIAWLVFHIRSHIRSAWWYFTKVELVELLSGAILVAAIVWIIGEVGSVMERLRRETK
ncbi:hypothetical protein [Alicyclobacillus tolerans]|uniref:Uncharacterized protein n=1 Tax=Alicyclobacillus tolerans TaxID=90970 RepID=A0A1M6UF68_9BACL|nr:hypothetical protein [Alicyclobacillus montanus]SHK67698.1 hypothetical protein SAMN05443507_11962 [Alicyclobacillus montanus]